MHAWHKLNVLLARAGLKILCHCFGYAAFNQDYLEHVVFKAATSRAEVGDYLASRRCPRLKIVLNGAALVACLILLSYPVATFFTLDIWDAAPPKPRVKQMGDSGDPNDGFAFTWLAGTRITYVNIMQMIIWTATILVVAVRV